MQKRLSLLLAALLALLPMVALAEEAGDASAPDHAYVMAGYDPASTGHDWNNNMFFQRMETQTGVGFTFRQYTDRGEWNKAKAALTSGGEDMPDVLFKAELTPAEEQALYAQGVLIDLAPYLAEHAPHLTALLDARPDFREAITLPSGAIAALPNLNELPANNALWVNRVWLERLGLAAPTTAEELTEVLRAFKNGDPNRNGRADEVPLTFTGLWDLRFLAHAYGLCSNDYGITAENGVVRETLTSSENRAFLAWLHQLWEEELIDHRGFNTASTTRQVTDDKAVICYGMVFGPSVGTMLPAAAMADYDVLMPLGGEGAAAYRSLLSEVTRGTFAITSHCQNPAELVAWVDFLYSQEGCMLAEAGLEGEEYQVLSDGSWSWIADAQTVARTILQEYTIAEGTAAPGYVPLSYQMNYDDDGAHRAVVMLDNLRQASALPYPLVYLTQEQQRRVDELWADIGPYSEITMARFVVGDYPLDDASWQSFCDTLREKGLDEMVAIWQGALD